MRCTKLFYQTKVVTNQNLQLLGYVTFFNILHHYGVIAASLICSVEKVLCRLTEQIFSIAFAAAPSMISKLEVRSDGTTDRAKDMLGPTPSPRMFRRQEKVTDIFTASVANKAIRDKIGVSLRLKE